MGDYVNNGQIVLNISPSAVKSLEIDNDGLSFNARFGGVPMQEFVPVVAILAIQARGNLTSPPAVANHRLRWLSNSVSPAASVAKKAALRAVFQKKEEQKNKKKKPIRTGKA